MRLARFLALTLEEPPSVNVLLRMHHRDRTRIRNDVWAQALQQKPRGWTPLERFRIDAELHLHTLRDPLELAGCLKLHVDALIHAGIIADDSRHNLIVGDVSQIVDRKNRGVTLRLYEELAEAAA